MPKTDESHLHSIPLFAGVPAKRLPLLRSLLTTVRTVQDSQVITTGTVGRELLVLASGSAQVVKGDAVVATLGAGDVFGEAALLTGETRNADVVVKAGSEIFAANPAEFRTILAEFPEVAERLEVIVAARA